MKLHRDIGVTQKTAWFMLHRIRKAFDRMTTNRLSTGLPRLMRPILAGCERT